MYRKDTCDYAPENPTEELFELVGRINAFAAYVNYAKSHIDREICAAMLGFELEDGGSSYEQWHKNDC